MDGNAWQTFILDALPELVPASKQTRQLSKAYAALSRHHHTAQGATGTPELAGIEPDALLLTRLLIYARRTYTAVSHLLPNMGASYDLAIEHGAALAPGLLALGQPDIPATAIELYESYEEPRARLFRKANLPPPEPRTSYTPLPSTPHSTLHLFTHSLYEISKGDAAAAVQHLLHLLNDNASSVLVLEPGDSKHATFLRAVRDHRNIMPAVRAPCLGPVICPMGSRPKDWCHFTLRNRPSRLEEQVIAKAGRDSHRLHFSFLYLHRTPIPGPRPDKPNQRMRILAVHPEGRAKLRVLTCGPSDLTELRVLRRDREAYDKTSALTPSAIISINPELPIKGDGIRVRRPADIETLSSA